MSVLPHTLPEAVPVNLDPTLYELSRADTSRFQKIKRAVWDEMIRRYAEDDSQIEGIEQGLLHRLFVEVTKVDFALTKQQGQDPEEQQGTSLLDIVNNPGLSPERKREILAAARQKVQGDLELLEELLASD